MTRPADPSAPNHALVTAFCGLLAGLVVLAGIALEYPRLGATFVESRVVSPISGQPQASDRRVFLPDPDAYMRVYRAKKILTGDAIRIREMPEINHPRGVELHWTAPMDYLLVGAGALFAPRINHPDPIGAAAAFVPVGLGALCVVAFIGWMKRGFGWGPALVAGIVIVISQPFHRVFRLGHPDHHALLELLFVVAVGAWVTRRREDGGFAPPARLGAMVSGLAIGLAVWVASHALLVWGPLAVGITFACYRADRADRGAWLAARLRWNLAAAAVVLAGYLIENWPDLGAMALDKISLIHVGLAGLALLVPGPLQSGDAEPALSATDVARERTRAPRGRPDRGSRLHDSAEQRRTTRFVAFLAALACFTIWMAVQYDTAAATIRGPELSRWHDLIAELQPLYTQAAGDWSLKRLHNMLGYLPYALPLLWISFVWSRRVPPVLRCTLGLLAPLFLILTIKQIRWMDHYNLAVAPVAVVGLFEAGRRLLARAEPELHALVAAVALFLLLHPPAFLLLDRRTEHMEIDNALLHRADFLAHSIAEFEREHGPPPADRQAILSEEGDGPILLYYTGRPVVAAPYHRAISGTVAISEFFALRDPGEARSQLDRLGVRYICIPSQLNQRLMNFEQIAYGELRSFEPPQVALNEFGVAVPTIRYLPQVTQTMAYRLTTDWQHETIPGVRCLRSGNEGAKAPDGTPVPTGMLFVVE